MTGVIDVRGTVEKVDNDARVKYKMSLTIDLHDRGDHIIHFQRWWVWARKPQGKYEYVFGMHITDRGIETLIRILRELDFSPEKHQVERIIKQRGGYGRA